MQTRIPAALTALALAAGACAQTLPLPPRDEKNASFWQRIDHPPPDALQPPRAWYTPLATLKGAPGPFLPAAAPGQFLPSGRCGLQPQILASNFPRQSAENSYRLSRKLGFYPLRHQSYLTSVVEPDGRGLIEFSE